MRPCRCPECMSDKSIKSCICIAADVDSRGTAPCNAHDAPDSTRSQQADLSTDLISVSSTRRKEVVLRDSEAQDDALTSIVELHSIHRKGVLGRDDLLVPPIGIAGLVPSLLLLGGCLCCCVLRLRPPGRHCDIPVSCAPHRLYRKCREQHPLNGIQ